MAGEAPPAGRSMWTDCSSRLPSSAPWAVSPVVGAVLATRCRCCHSSSYIPCFLVPVRLSTPAQVPTFCSPSRFPFRPGHLGTCPSRHRHGAWRLGAQPQVWGLRAGVGARPARRPPARHVASGSVSNGPKGICVKPLTGYREQNDETPSKAPAHAWPQGCCTRVEHTGRVCHWSTSRMGSRNLRGHPSLPAGRWPGGGPWNPSY